MSQLAEKHTPPKRHPDHKGLTRRRIPIGTSESPVPPVASLIGYHGYENAGDDAFCLILAKWAYQLLGIDKLEVSGVDARKPRLNADESIEVTGVVPEQRGGRIRRFLREPSFLIGKDIVLFGGGSIFASRRFWWLALQLGVLRLARKMGIVDTVVAAIGVSIGPFSRRGDAFWCRQALRQFDVITVRDHRSWDLGAKFGLKNLIPSYDLALTMPKFFRIPQHKQQPPRTPVVGFSVVDRDTHLGQPQVDDAKRAELVDAMIRLAQQDPSIRFRGFIFCRDQQEGDRIATEKITSQLLQAGCNVEIVEYENSPQLLLDQIAEVNVMICNRMHSFVFSCLTQTPAVMVSYAPKMVEFAKLVEVPANLQFSHSELDSDRLQQTLESLINSPEPPCDPAVLRRCSNDAIVDLELAAAMLHGRRAPSKPSKLGTPRRSHLVDLPASPATN